MAKIIWLSNEEKEINQLRSQRNHECFSVINRGGLWYDFLTEQEKYELLEWYEKWLNVTETMVVPEKPTWLK